MALSVAADRNRDIYIWDLAHRIPTPLTFEGNNAYPLWTLDGKRIAFGSNRQGKYAAYWKSADGAGKDEPLSPSLGLTPGSWADHGKTLVLTGWRAG